jgi:hypothetical protein
MTSRLEQTLVECGAKKACTIEELRAERFQLEMQLAVARLAASGVVANKASSRAALEAVMKSVENRAMTVAATERESLEAKLAQAEGVAVKLRAAMTIANEADEKDTTAASTIEAAAQTAA